MLKVKIKVDSHKVPFGIEYVGDAVVTIHDKGNLVEYQTPDGSKHSKDVWQNDGKFSTDSKLHIYRVSRLDSKIPTCPTDIYVSKGVASSYEKLSLLAIEKFATKNPDGYPLLLKAFEKDSRIDSFHAEYVVRGVALPGEADHLIKYDMDQFGYKNSSEAMSALTVCLDRVTAIQEYLQSVDPSSIPQEPSDKYIVIDKFGEVIAEELASKSGHQQYQAASGAEKTKKKFYVLAGGVALAILLIFGLPDDGKKDAPKDKPATTSVRPSKGASK